MRLIPLVLASASVVPLLAIKDPVKTESGLVSGTAGSTPTVHIYKGIPYAAPPVGGMRWKQPKPAAHWDGTREATQFPSACPQAPYPQNSVYYRPPEPTSEDCLALNIWTAAASSTERRPVMVWVHGGALTRGSGSVSAYDGEALALKGAVVVTINYRLGVFGFLAHPELTAESDVHSSGNYGILDQVAALEWVRTNIAAFGGDPKRVTIFGESAGSWSVNCLMATPLAKGLFQRVIGESGASFQPMETLKQAEQSGAKFASSIGADSLQAMRAKSADDLLKASAALPARPSVDGWMLPEDIYSIFAAGKQNDVALIAGSNADEGKTLAPWPPSRTAAEFVEQARARWGSFADQFLKLYPADSVEQARDSHYASFRDATFGWQMRTWVRMETKTGKSKAYLYYFSHVPPGPAGEKLGAYHASEIVYVFDNLKTRKTSAASDDQRLADTLSSYWVNFAKTGDPNGKGLPQWAAYKESTDTAMEFGDQVKPVVHLHQPALDFYDQYYAQQRAKK